MLHEFIFGSECGRGLCQDRQETRPQKATPRMPHILGMAWPPRTRVSCIALCCMLCPYATFQHFADTQLRRPRCCASASLLSFPGLSAVWCVAFFFIKKKGAPLEKGRPPPAKVGQISFVLFALFHPAQLPGVQGAGLVLERRAKLVGFRGGGVKAEGCQKGVARPGPGGLQRWAGSGCAWQGCAHGS